MAATCEAAAVMGSDRSSCHRLKKLPDPRSQAIPYFFLILHVAWQIPRQKFLLVEEAPYQRGQHPDETEHPPPRAERNRYAKKHHNAAGIHRMPHQRVGAGRYDFLVGSQ